MNRVITLILFFVQIFVINDIYAQRGNYPNPAAVYCERMGYEYHIDIDE
jgi:putative hemolysin